MKLEVNTNHKKAKPLSLLQPIKKITIGVLGTTIIISTYSGEVPVKAYSLDEESSISQEEIYNQEEVNIPESLRSEISYKVGKIPGDTITKSDLKNITILSLSGEIPEDMQFLQYCDNLESLYVIVRDETNLDFLTYAKSIKKLELTFQTLNNEKIETIPAIPQLESISFYSLWYNMELNIENLKFLNQMPNVKKISFSYIRLSPDCEEYLSKMEEIQLGTSETYDIDFKKLIGLKKLSLKHNKPYDIAIFLSTEEYNTLINAGVEIEFASEEERETYLKVASQLDDMVASLEIDKNSTDQEKLDTILIYVLNHLKYDSEVSEMILKDEIDKELTQSFYKNGYLYGAIEKDSAICGNYAALIEALMDRVSLPQQSTIMTSTNHAWNLVKVNNEVYLVDATWLDAQSKTEQKSTTNYDEQGNPLSVTITFEEKTAQELILSGKGHELSWYMENPSEENIASIDKKRAHYNPNTPTYMMNKLNEVSNESESENIEEITTTNLEAVAEEIPDISSEKIKIKIGTKEIIIGAGAFVGILVALGGAIAIKNQKERYRRKKSYNSNYNSSHNSFNSYSNSFGKKGYPSRFGKK